MSSLDTKAMFVPEGYYKIARYSIRYVQNDSKMIFWKENVIITNNK